MKGEAGIVGADQRIESKEIDVVGENQQLADAIALFDSAGSIGKDNGAQAERAEHAHGERDLLRRIAFVKMHAALHHEDGNAAEQTCDDAARMAFDC